MPMAKQVRKPINFKEEINKKLQGLYLKALKTRPGTKAQDLIIKEIDALNKLKDKFLNKSGSTAIKKKTLAADYKRPAYNVNTTGTFEFKTKNATYYPESYYFERANDKEDSLSIQEELKKELGSIIIKNSAWRNLNNGKSINARTSKGQIGKLKRID